MIKWLIILFLGSVFLQSNVQASENTLSEPSFNKPFLLDVGKTAVLSETVSLHFDSVSNDSRCPRDVQCFWPGEATLNMSLKIKEEEQSFELKVGGFDQLLESSQKVVEDIDIRVLWLSQEGNYYALFLVNSYDEGDSSEMETF